MFLQDLFNKTVFSKKRQIVKGKAIMLSILFSFTDEVIVLTPKFQSSFYINSILCFLIGVSIILNALDYYDPFISILLILIFSLGVVSYYIIIGLDVIGFFILSIYSGAIVIMFFISLLLLNIKPDIKYGGATNIVKYMFSCLLGFYIIGSNVGGGIYNHVQLCRFSYHELKTNTETLEILGNLFYQSPYIYVVGLLLLTTLLVFFLIFKKE